jgi:formylglycine-generating enzyme required for sulfatase activity
MNRLAFHEIRRRKPTSKGYPFNRFQLTRGSQIERETIMKNAWIVSCILLSLCLTGCASEAREGQIVQETSESQETETIPSEIEAIESTVNEGYGNYLLVPAGKFSMGDNYGEGNPRERPVHTVYLDASYIGEYEVSNAEYKRFMDHGGYDNREIWSNGGFGITSEPLHWYNAEYRGGGIPGNESFPVVGVSWYEAAAYCSWLSEETGSVYRLPTEAEWEKAARGGDYLDGDDNHRVPNPILQRRYPWGNDIDGSYANYLNSGDPYDNGLTPVSYYEGSMHDDFRTHNNASPYGAYDMSGNVYEWIDDGYSENYYQECLDEGMDTNPVDPKSGSGHVIRGSAFLYEVFKQRSAYRGAYYSTFRGAYIGIRCVRAISTSSLE